MAAHEKGADTVSAEQQAEVKRRSSRAAREGKRRRRNAARLTSPPTVQEATQAAIAASTDESVLASRAEARRQAKAQSSRKRSRGRRIVSNERTEGLRRFYRETLSEIRKVIWPDRETTRSLTLLVIALSIVLGIMLGGIDFVLYQIFEAF